MFDLPDLFYALLNLVFVFGTVTIYKEKDYTVEHKLLIKNAIARSKYREAFPVFQTIPVHKKRATYKELEEELGTSYSDDRERSYEYEVGYVDKEFSIPLVHAGYSISPHEKKRKDEGEANLNTTEDRFMKQFGSDEDMYVIAGETGLNGITGLSAAGTPADANLDLTSMQTARTTLNGIINQLNDALNNSSGDQTVKDVPITAFMTTDVMNRLFSFGSTLNDFVDMEKVFMDIADRRLRDLRIIVTNNLAATVTKKGRRYYVSTPGTIAFCMMPRDPSVCAVFKSEHIIIEKGDEMDGYRRVHEQRLVRADFQSALIINSNTVDIVT